MSNIKKLFPIFIVIFILVFELLIAQSIKVFDNSSVVASLFHQSRQGISQSLEPQIISAKVSPEKVYPGDIMVIRAEIKDNSGLKSVRADMGGIETIELKLIKGNLKDGIWQAQWLVHDTEIKNYVSIITAVNILNKTAFQSLNWQDSPATYYCDNKFCQADTSCDGCNTGEKCADSAPTCQYDSYAVQGGCGNFDLTCTADLVQYCYERDDWQTYCEKTATNCGTCHWDPTASKCCGDDGGSTDTWCTTGGSKDSCISGTWNDDHCSDGSQNCDETGVDVGGADCCTPNGDSCSPPGNCCSGYCRADYDEVGDFCAQDSTSCVHNGTQYTNGSYAPDCKVAGSETQTGERWKCAIGIWSGESCTTTTPYPSNCQYYYYTCSAGTPASCGQNTKTCGEGTAYSGGDCSATLCNSTWATSSGPGDNGYATSGDYYCQGTCDNDGNCDFAVNCSSNQGTIMSTAILFRNFSGASSWSEVTFSDDKTSENVDIKYRVYYTDDATCDTLIPDVAFPGNSDECNSDGFSTSPIVISGLDTATYSEICIEGDLIYSDGAIPPDETPKLFDWGVSVSLNQAPTMGSVSDDSPKGSNEGITFTTNDAQDTNVGDIIKLYICDSPDCTDCVAGGVTTSCWAVGSGVTATGTLQPLTATYTCPSCTTTIIEDYWAKVCDNYDACSILSTSTEILRPNATGSETSIETSPGGAAHYTQVDEENADNYTTYVGTQSATYQRDLYNLPAHSEGSGTIHHIKIYFRVLSLYGGDYAKPSLESDSTVTDGTEVSVSDSWTTHSQQWNANPANEQPWEWDDIDALEIGVSLKAPGYAVNCTQVYVEVGYTPSFTCTFSYPTSSEATSSPINTGEAEGVMFNSIMWQGIEPSGTNVRLQLATANATSGPWEFFGPDCTEVSYYKPAPDRPMEIGCYTETTSLGNYCNDGKQQYYKFKIFLDADSTRTLSPKVEKVIVNYSP